jgi:hypothetical protein
VCAWLTVFDIYESLNSKMFGQLINK